VGGGLLPMAVGQLQVYQLTHPHREQAPSHIGFSFTVNFRCCVDRLLQLQRRVELTDRIHHMP